MIQLSPPLSPTSRNAASRQTMTGPGTTPDRRAGAHLDHGRTGRAQRQMPAARIRAQQTSSAHAWAHSRPFTGPAAGTAPSSYGSTSATSDSFGSSLTAATSLATSVSSGVSAAEMLPAPRPTPQLRHSTRGPASEPPSAPPSEASSSVVGSPEPERMSFRPVDPSSPPSRGRAELRGTSRAAHNVRRYYCIVDALNAREGGRPAAARPAAEPTETRRELEPEVLQALERALRPLAQKQGYGAGARAPR